jgi:cytoskeletal protein CcmA (bactofilin family)
MFSKSGSNPPQPQPSATPTPAPQAAAPAPAPAAAPQPAPRVQKGASLVSADMLFEGDISGGGDIQIDGTVKGDVRVDHVTVGDSGQIEGGVYAEAVEVRGRVSGSITAKQVRLYGACHVDGDITHEQLAMETGAFFQGRSLRLQRPAPATQPARPAAAAPAPATPAPAAPASATAATAPAGQPN